MKATITTVELSLAIVNKDLATFNVNGAISGVVHLPSSGPVTVVLDGGYVLGEFHCPVCAVRTLAFCLRVLQKHRTPAACLITTTSANILTDMEDTACHCAVCFLEYKKSEMHERKTDIYPFKRTIYLCEQCNEKREKRDALRKVKRGIRKPFHSTSFFKY